MEQRTRFDAGRGRDRTADLARWFSAMGRGLRRVLVVVALLAFTGTAFVAFAFVGCTGPGAGVGSPRETPTVTAAQAIALHSDSIMSIPGVVGLYEGRTDKGETVIRVMLADRTREAMRMVPRKLEGYRVEVEESGPIQPMAK